MNQKILFQESFLMKTKVKKFFLIFSLAGLLSAVTAGLFINIFCFTNTNLTNEKVNVHIKKGWSVYHIARALKKTGLIKTTACFKTLAWLTKDSTRIQAGEYSFIKGSSPLEILNILVKGRTHLYKITFPEGYNIYEMADMLANSGFLNEQEFIFLSLDPDFINQMLKKNVDSLEGYLFPDTYYIPKPVSPQNLMSIMVRRFKAVYKNLKSRPPLNLNQHEAVTLASIVEKETGAGFERSLIAGVFYNRLRKKMRLESDPTILYGMMKEKGGLVELNIRRKDILKKTAYNTYRIAWPAGPISNPGKEALQAVFTPKQSSFLYFVSRNDGTHVFSSTYEEHKKAVDLWQKKFFKSKK